MALIAPFFLPYMQMQEATGFQRTLSGQYSANLGAWLISSAWAHRWWAPYLRHPARCLSWHSGDHCLASWARKRLTDPPDADDRRRDVAWYYIGLAIFTFWITFGPEGRSLHAALQHRPGVLVPAGALPRRHCRHAVPGRARGAGVHCPDAERAPTRRSPAAVLASADLYRAPLRDAKAPPLPHVYRTLATLPHGTGDRAAVLGDEHRVSPPRRSTCWRRPPTGSR